MFYLTEGKSTDTETGKSIQEGTLSYVIYILTLSYKNYPVPTNGGNITYV